VNTILGVALGILLVFLLFSLLVSAVNEAIFGYLTHLRSRVLEDSLHAILSNKAKGFSIIAVISRLFKRKSRALVSTPGATADTFSEQLLGHPLVKGLAAKNRGCPSYLPSATFADATLGTLLGLGSQASPPPGRPDDQVISGLADALSALKDDTARKILSSVLAGSKNLNEARARLETWFNNSMERVTGSYKRYTQFWLYVLATIIVVGLNVDTIELSQRLIADSRFRDALAAAAGNFVTQANGSNATAVADSASITPGLAGGDRHNSPTTTVPSPTVPQLLLEIGKLNLPLGWGACSNATEHSWIGTIITRLPRLEQSAGISTNSAVHGLVSEALGTSASCPKTPDAWRLKLFGLIITIAAISQGAPFWFDMLNRVTNVRAVGRPPQAK
jgi:hypothetical protein